MNFDFKETATAALVLFAVIDIIGSIPLIISLRQRVGHIQSEKASVVAGIIMIVFVFLGERILHLIGIDVSSFAVAGSLVLFALALEMVLGVHIFKDEVPQSAAVFPLAFPLIAGAGSLTTILSLRAEYHAINIVTAIVLNMIFVFVVLKSSQRIERFLGSNGINIIRKIFGVVLLAISIKLFATNAGGLID
ncbi:MAG TPA: hypothetical protein DDX92_11670 [Flavobacteriales bacterium]|jgi:multiple antibiotic resistance protein|nr:hypothetical protein [Flavobacteriales bacterium]